jgi:hypothetical protein
MNAVEAGFRLASAPISGQRHACQTSTAAMTQTPVATAMSNQRRERRRARPIVAEY